MLGLTGWQALQIMLIGFGVGLYDKYQRHKLKKQIKDYEKMVANIIEYDITYDFKYLPTLGISLDNTEKYIKAKHEKYGASITITNLDTSDSNGE